MGISQNETYILGSILNERVTSFGVKSVFRLPLMKRKIARILVGDCVAIGCGAPFR